MTNRQVEVVGGGPAGAFAARLIALQRPDWDVRLFERLSPDDTFGFGVGLTHGLLRAVESADPVVSARLEDAKFTFSDAEFRMPQGAIGFGQHHSGAIRRSALLRILLDSAVEAGVKVEIGTSATVDGLGDSADLIVGADGLSSSTRQRYADSFGPAATAGRGVYMWCGAEIELAGTVFMPVDTPAGAFVAHAYPHADGESTFVIESSEETLASAGFVDRTWSSDGESDDEALRYLSEAFSSLLSGGQFIGNRSRWTHFTTMRCRSWHHDNIVLLGDAAATVHPTLGSGTKVALESAIALARALDSVGDAAPSTALPIFESNRRMSVEKLQESATRSQLWWESFSQREHMPPEQLAAAYLSRAGAVSLQQMRESSPELATKAAAEFAGREVDEMPPPQLRDWVLNQPITIGDATVAGRLQSVDDVAAAHQLATIGVADGDAWGPEGDRVVNEAAALVDAGAEVIALRGDRGRSALLDTLAVAERLRIELSAVVAVEVDGERSHVDLAIDGLVSGRLDLILVAAP